MFSGLLIYHQADVARNQDFIDWLLAEAEKNGMKLDLFIREDLLIGIENGKPFLRQQNGEAVLRNFAIVRCADAIFTRHLEMIGMKTFNSAVVAELCHDKAKTLQVASMLGLPMADTFFLGETQQVKETAPYVMKERNGRGGQQVELVDDISKATPRGNSIAQKLVTPGRDVRVYVMGREIIASVERTNADDFRANYCLGSQAKIYDLKLEEKAIVEKLINLFEFGFVGIDLIYDKNGQPLLNEIEDVVGSRMLSKLTDINTAGVFLKHIKKVLMG